MQLSPQFQEIWLNSTRKERGKTVVQIIVSIVQSLYSPLQIAWSHIILSACQCVHMHVCAHACACVYVLYIIIHECIRTWVSTCYLIHKGSAETLLECVCTCIPNTYIQKLSWPISLAIVCVILHYLSFPPLPPPTNPPPFRLLPASWLINSSAGYYQHPEVVRFTAVPGDAVVCGGCRLEMSCSILRQETAANLPQPELEWIFNGSRLTELKVRMGIGCNSEQVARFTAA